VRSQPSGREPDQRGEDARSAQSSRGREWARRSAVEEHPGVHDKRAEHDDGHARAPIEQLYRQQLGRSAEQQRR
jgi:hypothetical protein